MSVQALLRAPTSSYKQELMLNSSVHVYILASIGNLHPGINYILTNAYVCYITTLTRHCHSASPLSVSLISLKVWLSVSHISLSVSLSVSLITVILLLGITHGFGFVVFLCTPERYFTFRQVPCLDYASINPFRFMNVQHASHAITILAFNYTSYMQSNMYMRVITL
ncbi:hypothetical protein RchiOBHm_Chr7g0237141 [Rosa chinensis]|uniref:Uncharacterized protein n=1 Tax=Rosa chinensis TaxID=74649 RepID=A0A2P6PH44_ROSCH|nr:hypothetical protein RchiOBHm_Chr7g0237141 [Rosa chinensis]